MERIQEHAVCNAARLFLWNEKLTKNQISPSEGLCVCLIRSTFNGIQPSAFNNYNYKKIGDRKRSTVIPFDLSKLLNKDASLGPMLVSATLQFLPQTIKQQGDDISFSLFTQFQFTQAFLKPPPRPTYVIVLEISHIRCIDFRPPFNLTLPPNFIPPPVPSHCRFVKNWNDMGRCGDIVDFVNDPYNRYRWDVVEYLKKLREYTGEGGICPTKPPIAMDVARGFVEVEVSYRSWCRNSAYCIMDLIDESCPVCYDEFKDENEVIATYCSHAFHIRWLLPWLSKKNTCPTCRAVYPLHYSPILDRQCQ